MRRSLIAMLVCLLATVPSLAADVTQAVPKDAYGYVVISSASELDSKIQALGQRMKLPIPSLIAMLAARPDFAAALNTDGSVTVAYLPSDKGASPVVFIPVKEYDDVVAQLDDASVEGGITQGMLQGKEVVVGKKQDHAVFARAEDRPALEAVLKYQAAPDAGIVQPDGEYDFAAVLTSSGLEKVTELAQQGLREATRVLKQQGGEDNPALAGLQMYDSVFTYAREELSSVTVSLRFDENSSLRITKRLWVKPTGKLAPMLKDIAVTDQDLLSGIPDIPFVVAMGFSMPEGSLQQLIDVSKLMMGSMQKLYKMTPEQIDGMMDLSMKYFKDMRGMSFLFGAGQGDDPLYGEMVAAIYVPDSNKYLDDYLKYWDELGDVLKGAEESFIAEASMEEITLSGNRVLKVQMPIPPMGNVGAEQQAELDALMSKMFGSKEMTMYLGAVNDQTVLIAYTSPDMLQKVWDADDASEVLSNNLDLNRTTSQLPKNPMMVGFWSPAGTTKFANRMLAMMPATGGIQIPELGESPPIGWTMHGKPEKVEFHAIVPVETFEAVAEFVTAMMMRGKEVAN